MLQIVRTMPGSTETKEDFMNKKLASIGLMCAFLAACGGDDTPAPAPAPAPQLSPEGFWEGQASTGTNVMLAVLENGATWGIYTHGGYIVGALAGYTSFDGNQLSGSGRDFNLLSSTVSYGTYTGTYSPRSRINVGLSNGSTFTGGYNAHYDQPASLAAITGTFSGTGVTGTTAPQAVAISVSSTGQVTVPSAQGCGGSGTVQPRASGKNVYDVMIRFLGVTCALGNGTTVRGIAVYDADQQNLWALALNDGKTDGFIYGAHKN